MQLKRSRESGPVCRLGAAESNNRLIVELRDCAVPILDMHCAPSRNEEPGDTVDIVQGDRLAWSQSFAHHMRPSTANQRLRLSQKNLEAHSQEATMA